MAKKSAVDKVEEVVKKEAKATKKEILKLIKEHLKLYRKKYSFWFIALMVVIVSTLLFIILSAQVHFALNNEIIILQRPSLQYQNVERNSSFNISYQIDVQTYSRCEATCEILAKDLVSNKTVFEKQLFVQPQIRENITLFLKTPEKGNGHYYIQATTTCQNKQAFLCVTQEKPYMQSSLFAVEYTLTEPEEQVVSQKEYFESVFSDFRTKVENLNQLNVSFDAIQENRQIDQFIEYWGGQEYENAFSSVSIQELNNTIREMSRQILNQLTYREKFNENRSKIHQQVEYVQNHSDFSFISQIIQTNELESYLFALEDATRSNEVPAPLNISNSVTEYELSLNKTIKRAIKLLAEQNISINRSYNLCADYRMLLDYNISLQSHCQNRTRPINFTFETRIIPIPTLENESVNLIEQKPICCELGKCQVCQNTKQVPVLFIHGHAFNKENLPEDSMVAFSTLQHKLEQEGFLNGGVIDTVSPYRLKPQAYASAQSPLTFRGTYYYISSYDVGDYHFTIQKSERIENYAIRLKELIDATLYTTGSDKVQIVAHSMGGLVVREYMSLFGHNHIERVITINTPHKGIEGRTKSTCSLIGAKNECVDMTVGSIFLRRLAQYNHNIVPFHVIRSDGCEMDDTSGDGVVTLDNAQLQATQDIIINGTCTDSLQTSLHNDVLDVDKYPEVFDILVDLLKD